MKQLGNSRPKPFLWVTHPELQAHIKERATADFGAKADVRKGRKAKQQKPVVPAAAQIDPFNLQLPPNMFAANDGTSLPQLSLEQVVKNARGVAFASPSDIHQFIQGGKFISVEGLSLLVIGQMPTSMPQSLPMHQLRVPAIYKATGDPIIIDCVSVQLGDQAVYQRTNQKAPEVAVFPTSVMRLHLFRDLWSLEGDWQDVIQHPIRSLVQSFDILSLCREEGCTDCTRYHPSCEETGIESGLVDSWGFLWRSHDGAKTTPTKADVLSAYVRIPESSGFRGAFFEPRNSETPGVDSTYSVIWLPKASLADAVHRVTTLDSRVAVCRIGTKYGVRCLAKHQEELHTLLCPEKPFVQCSVKNVHRLEPLPVGTQRKSLADILQDFGWVAKPFQPCPGSQGRAWLVGIDRDPPSQFIEAQIGWISISKVREHIQGSASSSAASSDPWQAGSDPWASWKQSKAVSQVPSLHVQQKFDDVEQRLEERVKTSVEAQLQSFAQTGQASQAQSEGRLQVVEAQLQTLAENQNKMQHWIQDGAHKVQELRSDCSQLTNAMSQCAVQVKDHGQALNALATDINQCTQSISAQGAGLQQVTTDVAGLQKDLGATLESYFAKQAEKLEEMWADKRARHV